MRLLYCAVIVVIIANIIANIIACKKKKIVVIHQSSMWFGVWTLKSRFFFLILSVPMLELSFVSLCD
jgi:hypothetical protein